MTWWIIITLLVIILLVMLSASAPKLSATQEAFIEKLNPAVQNRFRKFIWAIERKGYKVEIASCHRGWAKSLYMWQTMPEVRACCTPGRDYHYMGLACDFVIYTPEGKRLGNASSREEWEATGIPEIAARYNLQWGGMQGFSYWDPVHFAYTYDMGELVERVTAKCGGLEGDCGNKISLAGLTKT